MKRVLLLNPPYPFEESPSPPFGLLSLAGFLLQHNVDVRIEDFVVSKYSKEKLEHVIKAFKPHLVGATGVTMNIKRSINMLKDCREIAPDVVTVMGGAHVTFDAEDVLNENSHIDYIVRGEGEITFTELISSLEDDEKIRTIEGLSFVVDGSIVHNSNRGFIENINVLPYPARHLIKLSKYKGIGLAVNMVTSRGCPFECVFCVGSRMVGRRVRYFDVDRVVDEFEMLSKLGFIQINIADDLFTSNRKRCTDICKEIIRRGIKHPWTAFARVDTVSDELLAVMKEAGCTTVCYGIESGNQGILDKVKKKINLDLCKKAVEMAKRAGIVPMTSYILGLPGETPETVKETMEFAKKLSPNYGYHILAPFPGTEVREHADDYGIKILTSDWDKYDANQSVAESVTMSGEEVDRIVKKFYDGIQKYVNEAIEKYEKNEELTDQERSLVESFKTAEFTERLILDELLEHFYDIDKVSDENFVDKAVQHIADKTDFSKERISSEIRRLMDINCLSIINSESRKSIAWTTLNTPEGP